MRIDSTPASRWAGRYRKRYGYNFFGAIIFIGLIAMLFGGFGIVLGLACIAVGGFFIWKHNEFHRGKK